jgi:hypothetical protein
MYKWILLLCLISACQETYADLSANETIPVIGKTVYIVRHCDKWGSDVGCSQIGEQRARLLAQVFHNLIKSNKPAALITPRPGPKPCNLSHRPYQTMLPTSNYYEMAITSEYCQKQTAEEGTSIAEMFARRPIFVVWSHEDIPKLVEAMGGPLVPRWPDDRFDLIFQVTIPDAEQIQDIYGKSSLAIYTQRLGLPGDSFDVPKEYLPWATDDNAPRTQCPYVCPPYVTVISMISIALNLVFGMFCAFHCWSTRGFCCCWPRGHPYESIQDQVLQDPTPSAPSVDPMRQDPLPVSEEGSE